MPCLFPSVLIGAQVVHVCRHSLGERLVFMRDAGCPLLPAQARMGVGSEGTAEAKEAAAGNAESAVSEEAVSSADKGR